MRYNSGVIPNSLVSDDKELHKTQVWPGQTIEKQGRYVIVPWCRFFIPKMASPNVQPDDPDLNDHVRYAKCIKGHVLKDANDWILCENLPAPDAKCWQEGGDTIFSLMYRKRKEARTEAISPQRTDESLPQSTKS